MADVYVYIYDVSKGLAKTLSTSLIGKEIAGIWHTAIVVFGKEIFFGSTGISSCPPEGTLLGAPNTKEFLGRTSKSELALESHLVYLSTDIFHGSTYDLFYHNCNTFSNELSHWLVDCPIPQYITSLPHEVLETPFGQMIRPFMASISPGVQEQNQALAHYYDDGTVSDNNIVPVVYNDSCVSACRSFASELTQEQLNLIEDLTQISNGVNKSVSDEIIKLLIALTKPDVNNDICVYIFRVLAVCMLKNPLVLSILSCQFNDWMNQVYTQTTSTNNNTVDCEDLTKAKFIFYCNFLALTLPDHAVSSLLSLSDIFKSLIDEIVHSEKLDQHNSSLTLNILLNQQTIDEEQLTELICYYIHLLADNQSLVNHKTKENVVASIMIGVKRSKLLYDLAKAQDLHKRVRRETKYCLRLYKDLQN